MPAEAVATGHRMSPPEARSLGYQVEGSIRPLVALAARVVKCGGEDADDKRHNQAERADDLARFSAKELQDLVTEHNHIGGGAEDVETELFLAEALVASMNALANLLYFGNLSDPEIELPPEAAPWRSLPAQAEIISALDTLQAHAEKLFLRDSARERWEELVADEGAKVES